MLSGDDTKFDFAATWVIAQVDNAQEFTHTTKLLNLQTASAELYTGERVIERILTYTKHHSATVAMEQFVGAKVAALSAAGYEVIRIKITAAAWHPYAVMEREGRDGFQPYFQTQLPIHTPDRQELLALCHDHDLHLVHDGRGLYHGHLADAVDCVLRRSRSTHDQKQFAARIGDILRDAASRRLRTITQTPVISYCLYDGAPHHDKEWMSAPAGLPPLDITTASLNKFDPTGRPAVWPAVQYPVRSDWPQDKPAYTGLRSVP